MTTPQSEEEHTNPDSEIDILLDSHAEVYAKTTMQFITGEITEDERDKEWHHSDLKTRHALQRMLVEARLDELNMVNAAYHHTIDMKTTVSVAELAESDIGSILLDDPRTVNDLFRHVQSRMAELRKTVE